MGRREHLKPPGATALNPRFQIEDELAWLTRRRDLLVRAISEMEHYVGRPRPDADLMPHDPGLLDWAKGELSRIELRLSELTGGAG